MLLPYLSSLLHSELVVTVDGENTETKTAVKKQATRDLQRKTERSKQARKTTPRGDDSPIEGTAETRVRLGDDRQHVQVSK